MERQSEYFPPPVVVLNNDPKYEYKINLEMFSMLCRDLGIPTSQTNRIIIEFASFEATYRGSYNPLTSRVLIKTTTSTLPELIQTLAHELRHAQQWMKTNRSLWEIYRLRVQGMLICHLLNAINLMSALHSAKYLNKSMMLSTITVVVYTLIGVTNLFVSEKVNKKTYQNRPAEKDAREYASIVLQNYWEGKYSGLLVRVARG